MAVLTWLGVPGDAGKWSALGFFVSDDTVLIGRVACTLGRDPAWGFDALHADATALGVPTHVEPLPNEPGRHPNGIDRIDHVVYAVADLDEAVKTMTGVMGEPPRRRFHPRGAGGPEMAFFRVGEAFIEVVESGQPPGVWGIAFNSLDLEATVDTVRAAGGPIGDPKPAVQGGRIASVWNGHLGWGVAIMEPATRA